MSSVEPSALSAVQSAGGLGNTGSNFEKSTTSTSCGSSAAMAARANAMTRIKTVTAVFIAARRLYSIDFKEGVCQDAISGKDKMVADPGHGRSLDRAPDRDRPGIRRSLELAAKRCRRDCPKFLRERFRFHPAAN